MARRAVEPGCRVPRRRASTAGARHNQEQWDAVRADFPKMGVSDVRQRWLRQLFELLDFEPHYLRGPQR